MEILMRMVVGACAWAEELQAVTPVMASEAINVQSVLRLFVMVMSPAD
jgi:hypothetical protein